MICIKFELVDDQSKPLSKNNPTDSGYDLYTKLDREEVINPGSTVVIPTGVKLQLPKGYGAQIRPRSGVSSKTNLLVFVGTIDQTYRGELGIIVKNLGHYSERLPPGYKLAQLVLEKVYESCLEQVEHVSSDTDRGSKGFGSSGTT